MWKCAHITLAMVSRVRQELILTCHFSSLRPLSAWKSQQLIYLNIKINCLVAERKRRSCQWFTSSRNAVPQTFHRHPALQSYQRVWRKRTGNIWSNATQKKISYRRWKRTTNCVIKSYASQRGGASPGRGLYRKQAGCASWRIRPCAPYVPARVREIRSVTGSFIRPLYNSPHKRDCSFKRTHARARSLARSPRACLLHFRSYFHPVNGGGIVSTRRGAHRATVE